MAQAISDEEDFGEDLVYDSELEETLQTVERTGSAVLDIEDAVALSPFEEFRKRGYFSVSDLVGTIWCEYQYDYRLRTKPYLPPAKRPTEIKSSRGEIIKVDKVKVEGKERVLNRGRTIHERLEREIHPEKVVVKVQTDEDYWGLRMLNMLCSLEALLTLGKCRELPVAGYIGDYLIIGIIDEVTREPLISTPSKGRKTKPVTPSQSTDRQASLNDFFGGSKLPEPRTHRLLVSDSKTRVNGTVPKEHDTIAGQLQVMLYKELLDALLVPMPSSSTEDESSTRLLPTANPRGTGWAPLFAKLELDPSTKFSDAFIAAAWEIIIGNGLRFNADGATSLGELVVVWTRYVAALGLGTHGSGDKSSDGLTDDHLALVYRRAAAAKRKESARKRTKKGRRRGRQKGEPSDNQASAATELDEDAQLQLAIQMSLETQLQPVTETTPPLVESPEPETPIKPSNESISDSDDDVFVTPDTTPLSSRTRSSAATQLSSQVNPTPQHAPLKSSLTADFALLGSSMPPVSHAMLTLPTSAATQALAGSSSLPVPSAGSAPTNSTPSRPQSRQSKYWTSDSEQEREEAELAWAVEMSLGTRDTEVTTAPLLKSSPERTARVRSRSSSPPAGKKSGAIIGQTTFKHDRARLANHLESVLQYWMGERPPLGVGPDQVQRCGWCEFEENCEWRADKAREAWQRYLDRA